jgi:hypothetical protein
MCGVQGGLADGGSGFDAGGQERNSSLICLGTGGTSYGNTRILQGSNTEPVVSVSGQWSSAVYEIKLYRSGKFLAML